MISRVFSESFMAASVRRQAPHYRSARGRSAREPAHRQLLFGWALALLAIALFCSLGAGSWTRRDRSRRCSTPPRSVLARAPRRCRWRRPPIRRAPRLRLGAGRGPLRRRARCAARQPAAATAAPACACTACSCPTTAPRRCWSTWAGCRCRATARCRRSRCRAGDAAACAACWRRRRRRASPLGSRRRRRPTPGCWRPRSTTPALARRAASCRRSRRACCAWIPALAHRLCARPGHPAQHAAARAPLRLRRAVVRAGAGRADHRPGPDFRKRRGAERCHENAAMNPTPRPTRRPQPRARWILVLIFAAVLRHACSVAGVLRFTGWQPHGIEEQRRDAAARRSTCARSRAEAAPTAATTPGSRPSAPGASWSRRQPTATQRLRAAGQGPGHGVAAVRQQRRPRRRAVDRPAAAPARRATASLRRAAADARAAAPRCRASNDPAGVPVYVIDPNGFVILRYAPGFDPGSCAPTSRKLLKLI